MYNFRKPLGMVFVLNRTNFQNCTKNLVCQKFVLTFRTSLSLLLVMMVNVYDINMRSKYATICPYY